MICLGVSIPTVAILIFGFVIYIIKLKKELTKVKQRDDFPTKERLRVDKKRMRVKATIINDTPKIDRIQTDTVSLKVSINNYNINSRFHFPYLLVSIEVTKSENCHLN